MTNGEGDSIDEKALEAVVNAYYPQVFASAQAARERAQNAYTIASATAAAIVAAGVLAGIGDFPPIVQVFGALALGAWLVTAGTFMWVSREVPAPPSQEELAESSGDGDWLSAEAFVRFALSSVGTQVAQVEKRLRAALWTATIAMIITAAAFLSALIWPSEEMTSGVVTLTKEGAASLEIVCPGVAASSKLVGEVEIPSLSEDFVVIHAAAGLCPDAKGGILRIAKGDIHSFGESQEGTATTPAS